MNPIEITKIDRIFENYQEFEKLHAKTIFNYNRFLFNDSLSSLNEAICFCEETLKILKSQVKEDNKKK